MNKFTEQQKIKTKVVLTFNNPAQTLPVGSLGTILKIMSNGLLKVQFDKRRKFSIVSPAEVQPA